MIYDIAAIQYLYGANMSYHAGDDVYNPRTEGKEKIARLFSVHSHKRGRLDEAGAGGLTCRSR